MAIIDVINPSKKPRVGCVTVPWPGSSGFTPTAEHVRVIDQSGNVLPSQIDTIENERTLSFRLENPVPGADENSDYRIATSKVIVKQVSDVVSTPPVASGLEARVEAADNVGDTVIALSNSRLFVRLSLIPNTPQGSWYGGAAVSIQLGSERREILDDYQWEISRDKGLDPEKRCMQVDSVEVGPSDWVENSPWERIPRTVVPLLSMRFEVVSLASGSVRAGFALRSGTFECVDGNRQRTLTCRILRTLWMYPGTDFVLDQLYIQSEPNGQTIPVRLPFAPRFFTHIRLGQDRKRYRYGGIPDWFAIGAPYGRRQGYGFATDAHTIWFANPSPGYPVPARAIDTYAWMVGPSRKTRCLHLFMLNPGRFDDGTGVAWHDHIYQPLKGRWNTQPNVKE